MYEYPFIRVGLCRKGVPVGYWTDRRTLAQAENTVAQARAETVKLYDSLSLSKRREMAKTMGWPSPPPDKDE